MYKQFIWYCESGFLRHSFEGEKIDIWCFVAQAGITEPMIWQVMWPQKVSPFKKCNIQSCLGLLLIFLKMFCIDGLLFYYQ